MNYCMAGEIQIGPFKVIEGEYSTTNCFVKIENLGDRTHIQFAHKDFLLTNDTDLYRYLGGADSDIDILSDIYNPDLPFNSTNVPGINIIFDRESNIIEFGPTTCTHNRSNRIRSKVSKNSWEIGCGNKFSRINVDFKIDVNESNQITFMKFSEKYNKSRRFLILAPWKEKTAFDFECSGLEFQKE